MKRILILIGIILMLSSCMTFKKWINPVPLNKLRTGQTIEEVREFCRFPNKINTTVVNGKRHQQWVYDIGRRVYLYFESGILVAWQY